MRSNIALIACALALVGCRPRYSEPPDITHLPDGTPYSKTTYAEGRRDAENDLRQGRLIVEEYGYPRKGSREYAEMLQQRYGIEIRRVASDIVDRQAYGHAIGYNEVSKAEIKRRFGDNALKDAEDQAAKHWDEMQR
jgi:hypothetical protein